MNAFGGLCRSAWVNRERIVSTVGEPSGELKMPFQEVYEVVKTVEVVAALKPQGDGSTIRIEVLRDALNPGGDFSTRAYLQEDVTLQPTYPQDSNGFQRRPESMLIWAVWVDFPWTNRDTADGALQQALGWLRDHCEDSSAAVPPLNL